MEKNNQANQLIPIYTIDAESIRILMCNIGRFGWESIAGSLKIPYILRIINGEHLKFVSVRMAETVLLKKYIHFFNPEIYKICTSIKCQHVTVHEAELLNEINAMCNSVYGEDIFISDKDFIVRLEDVQEFLIFLELCYKKIQLNVNTKKFGLLRFESYILPYYTSNDQQFIPLFFFEGISEDLHQRSVLVEKWNFAYLKFCLKVMGIYDHLHDDKYCAVVSLNVIKNFNPQYKKFKDFWPPDMNKQSYITNQTAALNPPGSWIRPQEAIPAPKTIILPNFQDH